MNDGSGNLVTHTAAGVTAIAAALGISTQDMIYLIVSILGLIISIASFACKRADSHKYLLEDKKRTDVFESFIKGLTDESNKNTTSAAHSAITALNKLEEVRNESKSKK
jgi:hypothetical protein